MKTVAPAAGFLLLTAALFAQPYQYVVSKTAGGGAPPSPIAALDASINPVAAAADSIGNVYFTGYTYIYKMDSKGILTRIAGGGQFGTGGDGGPAIDATLYLHPGWIPSLAVDNIGNIYIGEPGSFRIRKISSDGTMSAFAGGNTSGYTGDGGPALAAHFGNASGIGFGGLAADQSGNVFIVDSNNFVVRKVSTNGIITTVAGNGKAG